MRQLKLLGRTLATLSGALLFSGTALAASGESYDFMLTNNSPLATQDNVMLHITVMDKKKTKNLLISGSNVLNTNIQMKSGATVFTPGIQLNDIARKKPVTVTVEVTGKYANYTTENPASGMYCLCEPSPSTSTCNAGALIDPAQEPDTYEAFCGETSTNGETKNARKIMTAKIDRGVASKNRPIN